MNYHHTQRAPLCLLLYTLAAVFCAVAWMAKDDPVVRWIFPLTALLVLLLAASFHHLTVADQGDHLLVQFGPVPLFRRRVKYTEIKSVEPGRTTVLDGWGIHLSLRGGWVWNLWGRDCVILHLRKSTLRIGSDDAPALTEFLTQKLKSAPTE